MKKANSRRGSRFEDFLRDEGIQEEVEAAAVKRVIAELIEEGMQRESLSKLQMAERMGTSRSQLERVLDPTNIAVQLDTLIKAARAVGQHLHISFHPVSAGTRNR